MERRRQGDPRIRHDQRHDIALGDAEQRGELCAEHYAEPARLKRGEIARNHPVGHDRHPCLCAWLDASELDCLDAPRRREQRGTPRQWRDGGHPRILGGERGNGFPVAQPPRGNDDRVRQ